jgi:peptide deformylase
MQIVGLDKIPEGDYKTPKDDLIKLYVASQKMIFLCNDKNGMGLAAAQVGLPWKLFVYWDNYPNSNKNFNCLVDCEYEPIDSKKSISIEGCLSLEGRFKLERFDNVRVFGKILKESSNVISLEEFDEVFSGVLSVVMQHEIDHQKGREKMIDKIGSRIYLS